MTSEVSPLTSSDLRAMLKKFGITNADIAKDAKPLVRLRMCQTLLGAAEAQVLYAEVEAREAGIDAAAIDDAHVMAWIGAGVTEGSAPLHLQARTMSLLALLDQLASGSRAAGADPVLAAAVYACAGLAELLGVHSAGAETGDKADRPERLAETVRLLRRAAELVNRHGGGAATAVPSGIAG